MDETDVLVARVGRAHGLGGEVSIEVRTDIPEQRFAAGVRLVTEPADRGPLTVRSTRLNGGVRLLAFEEVRDRDAAEALRGTRLYAAATLEEGGWYESELIGLAAVSPAGKALGTVTGLLVRPAQDLLVLDVGGREVLVPFVEAIVPEVDPGGGRVVVDAPPGLVDPDAAS